MRKVTLLFLFCCQALLAQEPTFSEKQERRSFNTTITVELHKPITFKLDTSLKPDWQSSDKIISFKTRLDVPPQVAFIKQPTTGGDIFYCWAPVGSYVISGESSLINWTRQDIDERQFSILLVVKSVGPQPTPVPDPIPVPQPNNPFPSTDGQPKLTVLLIEEQMDRGSISQEQLAIYSDREVLDYLDAKADWQLFDKDTIFSNQASKWKKALDLPRQKNFWVIISDGLKWESVELPKNKTDMLLLLKKYGG